MILRITRAQLQAFLKEDQDAIRTFERLFEQENEYYSMRPFKKTVTLTSALAGTAVTVLDMIGADERAYISGMILKVDGAIAWMDASATIVKIQDTSSVVGITIPKALLVGNAILFLSSASVALGDSVSEGTGFTLGSALSIVGDANFGSGSDIKCTLFGFIGL